MGQLGCVKHLSTKATITILNANCKQQQKNTQSSKEKIVSFEHNGYQQERFIYPIVMQNHRTLAILKEIL